MLDHVITRGHESALVAECNVCFGVFAWQKKCIAFAARRWVVSPGWSLNVASWQGFHFLPHLLVDGLSSLSGLAVDLRLRPLVTATKYDGVAHGDGLMEMRRQGNDAVLC